MKARIEDGDPFALHSLNLPNHECYLLSLDKVFPEYKIGKDDWLRVLAKFSEKDRQDTLNTVQRDAVWYAVLDATQESTQPEAAQATG